MPESLDIHEPLLVNTLGHSAGVLVFGIFLYLFLRDWRNARQRSSWLPAAAAALALFWNLGSLVVLAASVMPVPGSEWIVAVSFSVLSLLPAVLLHISLDGRFRPLWIAGYLLSAAAVAAHFAELAFPDSRLHNRALLAITIGFGLLTVASIVAVGRSRAGSRIFGTMCLFLFAMSFVHFGASHARQAWSGELAFHHAGIPLALFVLLQDYRFLLLDAYVRFLANAVMASAFAIGIIGINARFDLLDRSPGNAYLQGMLFVGVCVMMIVFAHVRARVQQWITRVVFGRANLENTLLAIRAQAAVTRSEQEFLQEGAALVAQFTGSERFALSLPPSPDWVEAVVPLRFSKGDLQEIHLGRRGGGRRYLSEDLQTLARIAAVIVEQVERLRSTRMQELVSQAELRALQAQINPHFLFNSLNALYGAIPRQSAGARQTVLNLAEIFRYFLQNDRTFIELSEELKIVRAYLEIEALRLGDRLETEIDIDDAALSARIPILSVQPLVENAVKHGVAPNAEPGRLRLSAKVRPSGEVQIQIEDSGSGFSRGPEEARSAGTGVGLDNVRQRLKLCYGEEVELQIESGAGGTKVGFLIPALQPVRKEHART
ncbi:MAG: histidine kinase [Bryobacteraceae bacterium]